MTRARQIANTLRHPQDMGVVELAERLASYATKPERDADYRARQAAIWDKMDAGIARAREITNV